MKLNNKKIKYKTIVLCGCVMRVRADKNELEKLLGQDKESIRKDWERNQLD